MRQNQKCLLANVILKRAVESSAYRLVMDLHRGFDRSGWGIGIGERPFGATRINRSGIS